VKMKFLEKIKRQSNLTKYRFRKYADGIPIRETLFGERVENER